VVGDVDNDGQNELISGEGDETQNGVVTVYEYNTATQAFEAAWSQSFPADSGSTEVTGLAVGDVDGDGLNELVVGNRQGSNLGAPVGGEVHVFENTGINTYAEVWSDFLGDMITVSIGDVDNDSANEIIASNMGGGSTSGTVIYDYNSGTLTYDRSWESNQIVDANEHENAVADVDNDGLNELIICGLSNTAVLKKNDGTYDIVWQTTVTTSEGKGSMFTGDADNDGINELLLAELTGGLQTLKVYKYSSGTYELIWTSPALSTVNPHSGLFVGELDNDGANEIIMNQNVYKFINSYFDIIFDGSSTDINGYPVFIGDPDNDGLNEWVTQGNTTFGIQVYSVVISATINITPETLNFKSKGNWVTCVIKLPTGYDVEP
jgi:hypothetical protein